MDHASRSEKDRMVGLLRKALAPLLTEAIIDKAAASISQEIVSELRTLNKNMAAQPQPAVDTDKFAQLLDDLNLLAHREPTYKIESPELVKLAARLETAITVLEKAAQPRKLQEPMEVRVANIKDIDLKNTQIVSTSKFPFKAPDNNSNQALTLVTTNSGVAAVPVANPDGSPFNSTTDAVMSGAYDPVTQSLRSSPQGIYTTVSGKLTAIGQTLVVDVSHANSAIIQLTGTYTSGAATFEASIDGGNTFPVVLLAARLDGNTQESATGTISNTARMWQVDVSGLTTIRIRCTAFASGDGMQFLVAPSAASVEPVIALGTVSATIVNSSATFIQDNAAFTDGTTRVTMTGFILDEVAGTALSENDAGAARMDSKRAQIATIEDVTTRGLRAAVTTSSGLRAGGFTADSPMPPELLPQGVSDGTTLRALRTPNVFKTATATGSGDTAVWTPATGKKFRLMAYMIQITADAAAALAADFDIILRDGTTGLAFGISVFVPNVAGTTFGNTASTGWITLGNGYLSTTINNVLNVNLSAALTSGKVRVVAIGTEE